MKTMVLLETENGARYTHLLDDVPTRKASRYFYVKN